MALKKPYLNTFEPKATNKQREFMRQSLIPFKASITAKEASLKIRVFLDKNRHKIPEKTRSLSFCLDEMTPAQIEYLSNNNIPYKLSMTKDEASKLINKHKGVPELKILKVNDAVRCMRSGFTGWVIELLPDGVIKVKARTGDILITSMYEVRHV